MMERRVFLTGIAMASLTPALAQAPQPRFPYETLWVAESLNGKRFASVSQPTLRVGRDGRVSGTTGCNRFGGTVTKLEGSALTFSPLAMTKMACFGAGGDNERVFAPAIGTATQWRLERRMLVIDTAEGPMRFRRR